MDWGSAVPFSVGWWAVVQDDFTTDGVVLPRGCLVRYREYYGMKPGQPGVGVKLSAEQVGMSIAAREKDEKISYGVLDPSAFAEDGGPQITSEAHTARYYSSGCSSCFMWSEAPRPPRKRPNPSS